ncbi:MAG: thiosulfate oxidation carrier complex protein SoxZ [Marinobacter sp.]|nr:thiosulfate oxidation carrier complex protein SoxZ [Marinobacter sp.]
MGTLFSSRFRVWLSVLLFSLLLTPASQAEQAWQRIPALEALLAETTPLRDGLTLDLPFVVDDGSAVAVGLNFSGQLQQGEYINTLHLLAPGNPRSEVMSLRLQSPQASPAQINTRMRLSQSQTVYLVAKSNQGRSWLASREVRVTVSGCAVADPDARNLVAMETPRIALPNRLRQGQPASIRIMINHPMETGLDETGERVAEANLVQSLTIQLAGEPLLQADFATGTAANPFVQFQLTPKESGELTFTWRDSQGNEVNETRELRL